METVSLSWQDYKTWLGDEWLADGDVKKATAPAVHLWNRDTRTLKPGEWYLPIVGESFDGHDFIAQALASGAAGFLYQEDRSAKIDPALLARGFCVKDSLKAIQRIAQGWRQRLSGCTLIALTGSTGKTTVKELLRLILHSQGPTVATYGSYNNELGVPLTLISIPEEARYAVLEMGARKPGDIRFLVDIATPDIASVLTVGTAHLGIFGSRRNLLLTKVEMFHHGNTNAVAVAPADDQDVMAEAKRSGKTVVSFGKSETADMRVSDVQWRAGGAMTLTLHSGGESHIVSLSVAHEAYPINICAAAAIAKAAGVPLAAIGASLQGFSGLAGRYKVHHVGAQTVIDDAYNANPESMRAGLTSIAKSFADKSVALVLGDMLELGEASAAEHEELGSFAGKLLSPKIVWCVGAEAERIASGIKKASPSSQVTTFANIDGAKAALRQAKFATDCVYLKASNGVRLTQLLPELLESAP